MTFSPQSCEDAPGNQSLPLGPEAARLGHNRSRTARKGLEVQWRTKEVTRASVALKRPTGGSVVLKRLTTESVVLKRLTTSSV